MKWGWILFWIVVFIIVAPVAAASFFHALGPLINHITASLSTFANSFH